MILVRATTTHAQLLEAVHRLCFTATEAWSAEVFASQLTMPGIFGLIAPEQGFVLARVAADEAEILTICVVPAARRHGVGRALLDGAANISASWGAVSLFLEVSTFNHAAFALYQLAGFERVGLRKRYYQDGSDGVILRKHL